MISYHMTMYTSPVNDQTGYNATYRREWPGKAIFAYALQSPLDRTFRVGEAETEISGTLPSYEEVDNCLLCLHTRSTMFNRVIKYYIGCGTPATTDPNAKCEAMWHSTRPCNWG